MIIKPPPEIRAVLHRTALFVSKNGRAFESKILAREEGKSAKFGFLLESSPFHAYYEHRVKFYEDGGTDDAEEEEKKKQKEAEEKLKQEELQKQQEAEAKQQHKTEQAASFDPVARALLHHRENIQNHYVSQDERKKQYEEEMKNEEDEEKKKLPFIPEPVPPPFQTPYVSNLVPPANITPMEVDTLKVVAQYTALSSVVRGAHSFLETIRTKEWNNVVFEFLKPQHSYFAYFTALVDCYKRILLVDRNSKAHRDHLRKCVEDPAGCTLNLAAYRVEYNLDRLEKKQNEEGEIGNQAALIDWQDFVVVETIHFHVDEKLVEQEDQAPAPPPVEQQPASYNRTEPVEGEDDMDMDSDDDEDGEQIKITTNYKPKVQQANAISDASRTQMIDPITGQAVALENMSEHMRIQLLDPKWAEERRRFMEKQKDSNFVSGDAMASNINRFAQKRGDIFGSTEEEMLLKDAESRKKLEEANRVMREQAQQFHTKPTAPLAPPGPSYPSLVTTGLQPTSTALPPPVLPATQMHSRPTLKMPESKKARIDTTTTMVSIMPSVPATQPPLPPPPPPPQTAGSATEQIPALAAPAADIAPRLLSADVFAASLSDPNVSCSIVVPNDTSYSHWNFDGRAIPLSINVMSKIKAIKSELQPLLGGMPVNKMQLKTTAQGFLKDSQTLAHLNLGPSTTIELVPKTRGGRK